MRSKNSYECNLFQEIHLKKFLVLFWVVEDACTFLPHCRWSTGLFPKPLLFLPKKTLVHNSWTTGHHIHLLIDTSLFQIKKLFLLGCVWLGMERMDAVFPVPFSNFFRLSCSSRLCMNYDSVVSWLQGSHYEQLVDKHSMFVPSCQSRGKRVPWCSCSHSPPAVGFWAPDAVKKWSGCGMSRRWSKKQLIAFWCVEQGGSLSLYLSIYIYAYIYIYHSFSLSMYLFLSVFKSSIIVLERKFIDTSKKTKNNFVSFVQKKNRSSASIGTKISYNIRIFCPALLMRVG